MNYYDALIEDLYKSILIIEHKDVYRFVTCCKKYTSFEIIQDDDVSINVFDLYTQQKRNIPLIEILRHFHHNIDDYDENDTVYLQRLESIKSIVDKCYNENLELTREIIYDIIIKPNTINIFDPSSKNEILDFLSYTKFILDINDIIGDIVPEYRKDNIIKCCRFLIEQKLNEILDELNTLKLQTSDPEDISDIDTIETMYKDSIKEIDYSSCKTFIDYLKNWPPLLLPMPEYIDIFISKIPKNQKFDDSFVDFMNIVDNSLTYSEIKELLDELETLQPSDKPIQNQMDLTPFKKYLSYKLNNEHK